MTSIKEISKDYPEDFVSLKAMKSPLKRIENKYRYQIMIKLARTREDEIMRRIYASVRENPFKDVIVFVEQDPQNLN